MTQRLTKLRKSLSRISLLWSIRLIWFISRLLPYGFGVQAGAALGFMGYYILPRERKRALTHLTSVFTDQGDAWIRRTARRSFMHLGKSMLEIMLMTPERLATIADFPGQDNLRTALAAGKGVVYVTGHIGNWELCGGVIAQHFPLSVVAAPIEPAPLNDMLVRLREQTGMKIILRGKPGASRQLIRIFKENRILGLLIDQDTDVEGAFVDFLGRPAWTPTAAASMAIKFGAPVVFGYTRRGRDNRHTVIVEGPLELVRTGDMEQDIIANTALFNRKIAECIMGEPEQWVWMHRRWRKQP
jgi:Kdo2-lipid IVA lauroyltransferase/acyltransferase